MTKSLASSKVLSILGILNGFESCLFLSVHLHLTQPESPSPQRGHFPVASDKAKGKKTETNT